MAESSRASCGRASGGCHSRASGGRWCHPSHGVAEHAAAQPATFPYVGLPTPAPGALLLDIGCVSGRQLGPFEFPCLPHQRAEQPPMPARAGPVLAMVSAQMCRTCTGDGECPDVYDHNCHIYHSDICSCGGTSLFLVYQLCAVSGTNFSSSCATSSCCVADYRYFWEFPGVVDQSCHPSH